MPTLGAQVVPAKTLETLRLLQDLSAEDVGALDETLGEWMSRPLGREALASVVLPTNGSLYLTLMNFEPAGLMLLERGRKASRVRALAIAPDMRRRGLARTALDTATQVAREAQLGWLWMVIDKDNTPAITCALACGYKRFRPQLMRRQRSGLISLVMGNAHVELLGGTEAKSQLTQWIAIAAEQGDAWCAELATNDLVAWNAPELDDGRTYLLVSGADEVGLAHISGDSQLRRIWLWLEQSLWNTEREDNVLKSIFDTLVDAPSSIEIEFGSHGHLRTSVERYKTLGFAPLVRDHVIFARRA